jgi:MFS family permease
MRYRPVILLSLCLAAFTIDVDVAIANVALPTLARQLGATTTDLQWVVDAYSLAFAALVLAAGSLSDRLGRKGALLAGLLLFAAASLAGAFAATAGELIAARAARRGRRRRETRGGRDGSDMTVILVTGASDSIGQAAAVRLARGGHRGGGDD